MKEGYFKEQYENAPLPYQSLDEKGTILIVNPAWCDALGYEKHEVLNKPYSDFLTEESLRTLQKNFPQLCSNGIIHDVEFDLIKKDGSIIHVILDGKVCYTETGDFKQTHCIFKTIESDKTQKIIETHNSNLFRSSNACMIIFDPETLDIIDANIRSSVLYGYSYKELTIKKMTDLSLSNEDDFRNTVQNILNGSIDFVEVRHIDKLGNIHFIETHPSVLKIDDQPYIFLIFHDITERKEKEKLLGIVNNIQATFLLDNMYQTFTDIVKILTDYFECEYGLVGYLDNEDSFIAPSIMPSALDRHKTENIDVVFSKSEWENCWRKTLIDNEIIIKSDDLKFPEGHIRLYNSMSVPIIKNNKALGMFIFGNKESGFLKNDEIKSLQIAQLMSPVFSYWLRNLFYKQELEQINTNLEEKIEKEIRISKKNEQVVFEQKKFIDMGQMINAIAHQWRQPLNNLQLVSQMMKKIYDGVDYDIGYAELFKTHQDLVIFMSNTIDDFRNFFSPNKNKTTLSIVKELLATIDLVKPQFENHGIGICFICSCDDNKIECDNSFGEQYCNKGKDKIDGYPNELKQVFLNILNNAKDAILESSKDDKKSIRINISVLHKDIEIKIFNYGSPIPEEIMSKIFDPYFTTKEEGKGTGIGLYMSKIIIEDSMNGKLSCSNIDNGVCFTIKLPLSNS